MQTYSHRKKLLAAFYIVCGIIVNPFVCIKLLRIDWVTNSISDGFHLLNLLVLGFFSCVFILYGILLISGQKNLALCKGAYYKICSAFFNKDILKSFETNVIRKKANAKILAYFRIVFSLLNVILILRYFQYFDVIWFHIERADVEVFLNGLLYFWLLLSLLLLVGIGGRLIGVLQLLTSLFVLRNVFTFDIFAITHLISSWVFILVRTDSIYSINNYFLQSNKQGLRTFACPFEQSSILGIYIAGWQFGLVFLYAGIDKMIDPLWLKGDGFYAFCVMSWTLPYNLKEIVNFHWLMLLGNYLSIIIEVLFFFLFLFQKTRIWAILLMASLLAGFIFPFNIFFIGLYSFNFCFVLLSICDHPRLKWPHQNIVKEVSLPRSLVGHRIIFSTLILFFLSFHAFKLMWSGFSSYKKSILTSGTNSMRTFERIVDLKPFSAPYDSSGSFFSTLYADLNLVKFPSSIQGLNASLFGCTPIALFSSAHLIGQYAYRVTLTKKTGDIIEPVKFFQNDKARGDLSATLFALNTLQSPMYPIGDASLYLAYGIDEPYQRKFVEEFMFYRLISFQLSKAGNADIKFASFLVAPINVPVNYKGFVQQSGSDWKEVMRYTLDDKAYRYVEQPVKQDFQARHAFLPNYLQRILYNKMMIE